MTDRDETRRAVRDQALRTASEWAWYAASDGAGRGKGDRRGGGSRRGRGRSHGRGGAMGGFGEGGPFDPFGSGGSFGPGGKRGRRSRGDMRAAILLLLSEEPMHGYQIIQELTDRSSGRWTPSPGAVYPALSQLERDGLIDVEADSQRRVFSLTEEGRAEAERLKEAGPAPWESTNAGSEDDSAMRMAIARVGSAAAQIARFGTAEQAAEAEKMLDKTARRLFAILARESES